MESMRLPIEQELRGALEREAELRREAGEVRRGGRAGQERPPQSPALLIAARRRPPD